MSERTPGFGLSALGPGDDPTEESYKYFYRDRYTIDSILLRSLRHDHRGIDEALVEPTTGLSLTLDDSIGGVIPASRRVYYRYSLVDTNGTETKGSATTFVDTPTAISAPGAPAGMTTTTTGGTLLPGSYYYRLSAYVDVNTQESLTGDSGFKVIPVGTSTNKITFNLPSLPAGATGFNIYRRKPGGDFGYLTSIDMNVATPPSSFTDDGSITDDCLRRLPTTNTANSSNAVIVSIPGATPVVPVGYTWKIYRSYSGSWTNSLLVHVVEETSEGSGIITPTYTDLGLATSSGSPLEVSPNFEGPGKISLVDGGEIEGIIPTAHVVYPHVEEFAFPGPLTITTGTFAWRCPFPEVYIRWVQCNLGRGYAAAATDVIVDVNKYDANAATPSWATIYTTQANRPKVLAGNWLGAAAVPDVQTLLLGDVLTVDIDQTGGGATPTDQDLLVQIVMWVHDSTTTSITVFD
jgi:hypothetical protein